MLCRDCAPARAGPPCSESIGNRTAVRPRRLPKLAEWIRLYPLVLQGLSFRDAIQVINRRAFDLLLQAARPVDLHTVDLRRRSQTEMRVFRALPGIAVAAVDFADLREPSRGHLNAGADRVAIRLRAGELELDIVARRRGIQMVEERALV